MGRGRSPAWPENQALDYLLVRRQVKNGAASHFLTVLDAFQGAPTVRSVRLLREKPLVIEVRRADGVDEITIHIPDGPSRTTAHRPLGIRVQSRTDEKVARDVRIGDLGNGAGPGYAQGKIVAVDYDRQQIVVEAAGAQLDDFAAGHAIRIHNTMRSSMFRITDAKAEAPGRFRVTLDKTALVAQLPVSEVEGNRLKLTAKPAFATGHVDEKTGRLIDGPNDYYYGCWIGEGKAARLVAGISNTTPPWLHLVGTHDEAEVRADYVGKVVNVWLYGVGDKIEVARIKR